VTRRRWIAEHWDEVTATIVGAQAEHMARVLRAQPGMDVDVVAGGHVFHAEVAAVTPAEVRFNLIASCKPIPRCRSRWFYPSINSIAWSGLSKRPLNLALPRGPSCRAPE